MENKLVFQFFTMVISFFVIWFMLSKIDFVNENEVAKFAKDKEKKLAELMLKTINTANDEIKNENINKILDSIAQRICERNNMDCSKIKLHIVRSSEINAFALPDHNMVIYTGLLEYAKNAEEVAGVMAHEMGHMEKNHVMKKLMKEIGLGMLFTIAGGDAGFEIIKETARVLSSTAFDRTQETEADLYAVELLANADIDPEHFGNIMFRLSKKHDIPDELVWISTHPEGKERASEILKKKKEYSYQSEPIIDTPWDSVINMIDSVEPLAD